MNKQEALNWLDLCIGNEELTEKKDIIFAKASKELSEKQKLEVLKDSEFTLEILKELREYVRVNLR